MIASEFWQVDLNAHLATHTLTGLRVRFVEHEDGTRFARPISPVPAGVSLENGATLLREADDAYLEAILLELD